MPKDVNINIFINASKQYLVNRTEKSAEVIERKLRLLSEIGDENIFDPSANGAGPEFYVALHELLTKVEPNSSLAHAATEVLTKAIHNKAARPQIINVYRFSWPVARLFLAIPPRATKSESWKDNPAKDNQNFKLLCLLRELTYGINLLWQESHLPCLIKALLDIVTGTLTDSNTSAEENKGQDDADERLAVALAILVNLCHRNLPAVYCLLRTIDGREFIRTLLRLNEGTISHDANVQVSKMLIILEGVSGGIPNSSMQAFVHLMFTSMKEALVHQNSFLLRHVVDFFSDVRGDGSSRPREALLSYSGYKEGVELLLAAAAGGCSSEEACHLLDFLCSLVELGVEGIKTLHPSLACLAISWIKGNGEASHHALNLLCMLMLSCTGISGKEHGEDDIQMDFLEDENKEDSAKRKRISIAFSRRQSIQQAKNTEDNFGNGSSMTPSVESLVKQSLPDLLLMLEASTKDLTQNLPAKGETRVLLKSLFQLLSEMARIPELRQEMEDKINKEVFASVFDPILGSESFIADDLFQMDVVSLYTEALRVGTMLAFKSAPWLTLCSHLLSHSQVLSLLAMALLGGDWVLRERVLTLVSTIAFPEASVADLAKAMSNMKSFLMASDKDGVRDMFCGDSISSQFSSGGLSLGHPRKLNEVFPLLTQEQESRLDSFISVLQKAKDENKIEDIAMSALIELYEYKLAGMGHAERSLQSSLEVATTHSTLLQQKVAQSSVELSRLHQLLYYKQQCLEGCQSEKQRLTLQLQNEELKAMEKHSQHMQEMRARMRDIEVSHRREAAMKKELEVLNKQKEEAEAENAKVIAGLIETNECLKESLHHKDKLLDEKQKELDKAMKALKEQQEDNNSLRLANKRNEQIILEKEAKVKETSKELQELQRIREVIYEISAGKKKMEK